MAKKDGCMNIYVGNLDYKTTEDEIKAAFEQHGEVESVNIITDKYSGQSKGFAFVTMPNDDEAQAAMDALDGQMLGGRNIKIDKARPRKNRGKGQNRSNRW